MILVPNVCGSQLTMLSPLNDLVWHVTFLINHSHRLLKMIPNHWRKAFWWTRTEGAKHVDRDRPVDRRVSVGRSRLILHWIDMIAKNNIFQSIYQKVHENEIRCILWYFALVTLLPTGRSRVIKKFSSRSQWKTNWPPPELGHFQHFRVI